MGQRAVGKVPVLVWPAATHDSCSTMTESGFGRCKQASLIPVFEENSNGRSQWVWLCWSNLVLALSSDSSLGYRCISRSFWQQRQISRPHLHLYISHVPHHCSHFQLHFIKTKWVNRKHFPHVFLQHRGCFLLIRHLFKAESLLTVFGSHFQLYHTFLAMLLIWLLWQKEQNRLITKAESFSVLVQKELFSNKDMTIKEVGRKESSHESHTPCTAQALEQTGCTTQLVD